MAKGRKWSISRNERFIGSYSNGYAQSSNNGDESSEFREEDVWSMIHNNNSTTGEDDNYGGISVKTRHRSSQRDERTVGGVSIVFQDSGRTTAAASERSNTRGRHTAASAPVNVPDWSKILRAESMESLPAMVDGGYYDNDEAELVPPHEFLARNRNAAATSVFEGVGRTLKGRDMRRVRDAVWSQTGFNG